MLMNPRGLSMQMRVVTYVGGMHRQLIHFLVVPLKSSCSSMVHRQSPSPPFNPTYANQDKGPIKYANSQDHRLANNNSRLNRELASFACRVVTVLICIQDQQGLDLAQGLEDVSGCWDIRKRK